MEKEIEHQRDIGKIWGEIRELHAWAEGKFRELTILLIGPTGENGLRSDFHKLETRVDKLEEKVGEAIEWGHHVWDVTRHEPGQCIGKVAVIDLEDRLKRDAEMREHEVLEMRKARLTMVGGLIVALVTALGPIIIELIKGGN